MVSTFGEVKFSYFQIKILDNVNGTSSIVKSLGVSKVGSIERYITRFHF